MSIFRRLKIDASLVSIFKHLKIDEETLHNFRVSGDATKLGSPLPSPEHKPSKEQAVDSKKKEENSDIPKFRSDRNRLSMRTAKEILF